MSEEQLSDVHCNVCNHKTEHLLLTRRSNSGSEKVDYDISISWDTINEVLECRGCKEVTLRRRFYFSEWDHGDVEETYYPPRIGRALPRWKDQLSDDKTSLLEEVYTALQANSLRISMMGARALIDMVMTEKIGDKGTFPQKLNELETQGYISTKNRDLLEAALDVGNAASHRGYRPRKAHVEAVMDIVENLLQSTVLEGYVDELKAATPKRKKK